MGKKRHGSGQHLPKSAEQGHGHGAGSSGTPGTASGQHAPINRTRTKLSTKRQQVRNLNNVAPPGQYEVVTVIGTTTSTPSSRGVNGEGTPRQRVRSQFTRKRDSGHDEKGKGKGMPSEAELSD